MEALFFCIAYRLTLPLMSLKRRFDVLCCADEETIQPDHRMQPRAAQRPETAAEQESRLFHAIPGQSHPIDICAWQNLLLFFFRFSASFGL